MSKKENDLSPEEEMEILPFFSVDEQEERLMQEEEYSYDLPVLALKNTVLFPGVVIPVTVGRERSIAAVQDAYADGKHILVFAQKDMEVDEPKLKDLHALGVVAKILRLIKMPDDSYTAILQGRRRTGRERKALQTLPFLRAEPILLVDEPPKKKEQIEFEATLQSIREKSEALIDISPQIPSDAVQLLHKIQNSGFLVNFVATNMQVSVSAKQELLNESKLLKRAKILLDQLSIQLHITEIRAELEEKVREEMEKQQRDYILNQQMKLIQDELGENPQSQEVDRLRAKAADKDWSEAVQEKFDRELRRLERTNPMAPDYSLTLNYLETLVDLPWNEFSQDNFDLNKAEKILDQDHYGLDKVKDRILEYLAVLELRQDMKAPIICLLGPPGVGKTSLGRSVASALNREYIRMSLGGLHDESELRGHRKTYIGAMPGRIIQSLKKAGSSNPVFILDEIDKMGRGQRGDPSSALLEILDPEQNSSFYDNYLELDYDLSKVLFIATSNSLSAIQPALLDRMEIIELSGYSVEEKLEIAKRHLIPKQRKEHGLSGNQFRIGAKALQTLVSDYTQESGVRKLERQIARLMRIAAKQIAQGDKKQVRFSTAQDVEDALGIKTTVKDIYEEKLPAGVAVGLAWTQVGGEILFIEASLSPGKGKLQLTGNLGDVMKESAALALSYLKSHAEEFGIEASLFEQRDVHLHVPAGAVPKDGPSAGITMLSALASAFKGKALRSHLAMTGEISLRGRVLRVGGIKEKILAAKRAGVKELILCEDNRPHVMEVKAEYIKGLEFHYVKRMEDVLKIALR